MESLKILLKNVGFITLILICTHKMLNAESNDKNIGKDDYIKYCSECHGSKGRGDGPTASELGSVPTDLTMLSKNNDGLFPEILVFNVIDGRRASDFHGQEMPIWGEQFSEIDDSEEAVKKRINNLVIFLKSIQIK